MSLEKSVDLYDVVHEQFLTLDSLLHAANRLIPAKPETDEMDGIRHLMDAAERLSETTRDRICNLLEGVEKTTNTKIMVRHNDNFEIVGASFERSDSHPAKNGGAA